MLLSVRWHKRAALCDVIYWKWPESRIIERFMSTSTPSAHHIRVKLLCDSTKQKEDGKKPYQVETSMLYRKVALATEIVQIYISDDAHRWGRVLVL
jgi:hypothetical protein